MTLIGRQKVQYRTYATLVDNYQESFLLGHYIAIASCFGEHDKLQTTIELDISISSRRGVTQETQFQVNMDLIPICVDMVLMRISRR